MNTPLILLSTLFALVTWTFIGAIVWSSIDDKDQSLFRWYSAAPMEILKVGVLLAWPVGLYFWWRDRK